MDYCMYCLQTVPDQLAGGARGEHALQGGGRAERAQGRHPALVQRLPIPHTERHSIRARHRQDVQAGRARPIRQHDGQVRVSWWRVLSIADGSCPTRTH